MADHSPHRSRGLGRGCFPGELGDCLEYGLDVGCDSGIVGDPSVADDALSVDDEGGALAHAPEAAVWLLRRVGDTELTDDLPVEVARQRERQVEVLGEGGVGAVALDREADDAGAEGGKAVVVRTEPLELECSDTAEVEQVPGEHDGTALEVVG